MIKTTRFEEIERHAETIAVEMFLEMLNPLKRGTSFRFSTFNIAKFARAQLISPRPTEEEKVKIGEIAETKWREMIKTVGAAIPKSCL